MKKNTGNKIRLGVFVTASILLFIVGIYFIGQKQQMFNSTFQISGIFKDINGLQIGNNVRLSGINVGIIEDIQQLTDTTVKVDMMIDEKARKFIKVNAKALIGSDGLMGNKIVQIIPGEAGKKVIADNAILETSQSVSMDDILKKVQIVCDNAANITGDLSGITENIYAGKGTIGKLIMDSTLAENIDAALVNIKQGTNGFKQNMDAAGHNVLLRGYFKKKARKKEK